jgi:hypothetical protein
MVHNGRMKHTPNKQTTTIVKISHNQKTTTTTINDKHCTTASNVPGEQRCRDTKISRIYQHDIVVITPGQHKVVGLVRSMVLGLLGPAGLLHRSGSSCGTNSFVTWKAQRTRVLATKRSHVRTCRGALALTVAQNTVHGRVQHQVLVVFQPDILGHVLCPVFMQQGLRVKRRRGEVRPSWTKASNKDTHGKERLDRGGRLCQYHLLDACALTTRASS